MMKSDRPFAVVTTTQAPTPSIRTLADSLKPFGCPLLIIGDKNGPFTYDAKGTELLTLEQQIKLPFKLAPLLPEGHYTRKNLGFLIAMKRGATSIYETDDDNAPLANWHWRDRQTKARELAAQGWVNVYRFFSNEKIWPRGFPLDLIRQPLPGHASPDALLEIDAPIQQGLTNGSPDVDAVWRLVFDTHVTFRNEPSVYLPKGAWCPFNSQSTWWWPQAYPLMYLPSGCSFRMTDIWRSFIAQRCLWEMNTGLVFHAAEVIQDRNVHKLMKNFEDEISGYLKNDEIIGHLACLSLESGQKSAGPNLLKCYEALVEKNVFPASELALVKAWLADAG